MTLSELVAGRVDARHMANRDSNLLCPACNLAFPRDSLDDLRNGCFRAASPCPACGRMLQFAKRPWRLMYIASVVGLPAILGPVICALFGVFPGPNSPWWFGPRTFPLFLLASLLLWWSAVRYHRLEPVPSDSPRWKTTTADNHVVNQSPRSGVS